MVAKMLSRSDSWGRSIVGFHACSSASGAVLERPVWERLFGVTSATPGEGGWETAWPGCCDAFDLTEAAGEAIFGAFECGDMESTLVNPGEGNPGVGARMADITGADVGSSVVAAGEIVGRRFAHNRGLAGSSLRGRRRRRGSRAERAGPGA